MDTTTLKMDQQTVLTCVLVDTTAQTQTMLFNVMLVSTVQRESPTALCVHQVHGAWWDIQNAPSVTQAKTALLITKHQAIVQQGLTVSAVMLVAQSVCQVNTAVLVVLTALFVLLVTLVRPIPQFHARRERTAKKAGMGVCSALMVITAYF